MRFKVALLTALSLVVGIVAQPVIAATPPQELVVDWKQTPAKLKSAVEVMLLSLEAHDLLDKVESQGPIKIVARHMTAGGFEASWNSGSRTISINMSGNRQVGDLICSLLMELHNASTSDRLNQLVAQARSGAITKEQFVEGVERMEHRNALGTSQVIDRGIEEGIYPSAARWRVFRRFDDHYQLQQLGSHSKWIADSYGRYNQRGASMPYKGTIPNIARLTPSERRMMIQWLVVKNDMNSANPYIATRAKESRDAEYSRSTPGSHHRSLLHQVFEG